MFFIVRFILVWLIWIIFADKKRWREILPVCILASFCGVVSDILIEYYPYWDYSDNRVSPLFIDLGDEFEIFPVATYLFIQWLPKKSAWIMLCYWFVWTGAAITIEYIHLITEHMEHLNGWNLWYSYIADWVLFWVFYQYHKILRLERLSK